MQIYSSSDGPAPKVVFHKKIEDIQGGITICSADFVADDIIPAGSVVGKDNNGLFHVLKTAKLYSAATNTATTYSVNKGHGLKVGDIIGALTGAKAYTITAIDKTNADYDILTVGTTLGVAIAQNAGIFQAAAESSTTTSAFKVTPYAVTGDSVQIKVGDNHLVDAYLRATIFEALAPIVTSQIKAALPQIMWI
jgi:hypothetical protein